MTITSRYQHDDKLPAVCLVKTIGQSDWCLATDYLLVWMRPTDVHWLYQRISILGHTLLPHPCPTVRLCGANFSVIKFRRSYIRRIRLVYWAWWPLLASLRFGYFPGHSGPLSLAIPSWVGAMSTGDGFGHRWGRNGEFCLAIGPVTRTAGILVYCRPMLR